MTGDVTSEPEGRDSKPAVAPKQPSAVDKDAAHYFLSELRTRISIQPLPYQHGDEGSALQSLRDVYDHAREAMKKYPGCDLFADKVTEMLNLYLRPVTAKWHRAKLEGRLDSRDGAEEFRGELENVQNKLREFASDLHKMAYGGTWQDKFSPPVIKDCYLDAYFNPAAPLECGIGEKCAEIDEAERKALKTRRELYGLDKTPDDKPEKNAIGLALSGGGIRSATFCLGVVQLLAKRGLFKDIDFLSTVSGGGYAGCFVTTRLGAERRDQTLSDEKQKLESQVRELDARRKATSKDLEELNKETAGLNAKLSKVTEDLKQASEKTAKKKEADDRQKSIAGPDGPDPDEVRYLRRHAKYLAALDLKQAWFMATSTLAGMLLNWTVPLSLIFMAAAVLGAAAHWTGVQELQWPWIVAAAAVFSFVFLLAYGWILPSGKKAAAPAGWILAFGLAVTAVGAVLWLIQVGFQFLTTHWVSSSLMATLVTGAPAIMRFVPVVKNPTVRKTALKVLLWLAAIIVPLGAMALLYFLVHVGRDNYAIAGGLFVAGLFCLVFSSWRLNINFTGPHRLYRDQLARTFVQTDERKDDDVPLASINRSGYAPYHLINTTLNVPSSTAVALRERKSDFFLFSKNFCGAPATGYRATDNWQPNDASPDLATAMAISGAAASSYMGLGSMPTLTSLLTLLNVRLGFWIKNPEVATWFRYPGFVCLLREMFGFSMSETKSWLNLSDGGHIENLAIYELLRRRCKMIISVDGEADPNYTFEGLMTVVRHAQIDFGVRIKVDLSDIRPDPKTGYSRSHAALCTVHYPDGAIGFIIYMKLSVTGNESEMIRRYRINHPEFPHQSTLDQFFDEEQFEVYRQLGVHVADGLFLPALMSPVAPTDIGSVPKWFRQLVRNLLPGTIPGIKPVAATAVAAATSASAPAS